MNLTRSILLLTCGVALGISFVISCGDNLHINTDAAIDTPKAEADAAQACDCPATEPPLAGRFMVVNLTEIIAPNDYTGNAPVCPPGTQLISASCTTDLLNPVRNVTLGQSGYYGPPPSNWWCHFRNHEAIPVTIRISIICLKPMP